MEQIASEADTRARKDTSDKAANTYMSELLSGPRSDILTRIARDPALTWETRKTLGEIAEKQSEEAGVGAPRKYGPGFANAYRAIVAPAEDPARISDPIQVMRRAAPGGDLSLAGAEKLITVMGQIKRSNDDSAVHASISSLQTYGNKKLSFDQEMLFPGAPPLRDPRGAQVFNSEFVPQFQAAADKWITAGKDPWDPKGPLTKEFVDKLAARLRSPSEMSMSRLAATGDTSPVPTTALPPPPGDVDASAWANVVRAPPSRPNGTPWPATNWARAVDTLRSNPTPDAITAFNKHFAAQGFDGAKIVRQLSGRTAAPSAQTAVLPASAAADMGTPP